MNFLNIKTKIHFYSMSFYEFIFHSVFNINKLLGPKGCHNKASTNLVGLTGHSSTLRQTEPPAAGLHVYHHRCFLLLPSLEIVFSAVPLMGTLVSFPNPSPVSHETTGASFSKTPKSLIYHSFNIVCFT